MDKLERILQNSARQATEALPVDTMWESLQKAAQIKRQKRKLLLRQASMAAMLIVSLSVGVALGRSPMFSPAYVIVDPPKTDATPAPPEETPDNTVIDPPGYTTIPDNIVVDPPKTDPGTPAEVFVSMREFKHLPKTDSIKDLLPGWLPDILLDQRFVQNIPENHWVAETSDPNQFFTLSVVEWSYIQEVLNERAEGLPEGFSAETLPVGTGVLLHFEEEEGEEGDIFREMWYLRTGDYSYVECMADGLLPEDVIKIIDNLGK